MRFCKYCGTEISETDRQCPNCKRNLGQTLAEKDNRKNTTQNHTKAVMKVMENPPKLLIAIAVAGILIIAIILTGGRCEYTGCKNKAVSGSDYCYSHKCVISSCTDSRYSYSNYCYNHYWIYGDEAESGFEGESVSSSDLKISGIELSTNTSHTIAEGKIKNNSDRTVSFVKIKGAFETGSGAVVDTDWTYAVGAEGLAPGESCKWKMSVSKDWSIEDCTVTIIDFDY